MTLRPYQPSDAEAVLEIAKAQGLDVYVPLPDRDPAVISGIVGVEDGRMVLAIVGRLSVEAHCIMRPDEPNGARKVRRAMEASEGYILAVSERMQRFGFPGVSDAQAYVPSWMTRFRAVMERLLGWLPEPEGYTVYYKRLGAGAEEAVRALRRSAK